jgi:hypothetical protein
MLCAEAFEMSKCVLTLSLAKLRWNDRTVLEMYELLFMLICLAKIVLKWQHTTLGFELHFC